MALAMPPPRTGSLRRKRTQLGISYGLRFKYRGEEYYHHIGGSWEGWNEGRAEDERRYVMAQVERGEYVPQRRDAAPPPSGADMPTFQVLASIVLDRTRRRVEESSAADLEWRLRTAMDHFGPIPVDRIDVGTIDEFVDLKLREREAIDRAAAGGTPLTEEYYDHRLAKHYRRGRRGLSNSSINKVLGGVRRVLREAKRRHLIEHNPLDDSDCFLRTRVPSRSFLELVQIEALLDAARLIDSEHPGLSWRDVCAIRADERPATQLARMFGVSETLIRRIRRGEIWQREGRRHVARLPVIATLVLAGPRIKEACLLDAPDDIDLAGRGVRIPRVKTDAAERVVPMVPALHEILLADRAERGAPAAAPAFPTRNGTRQNPNNVRARLLAGVHQRANALLAQRGQRQIGHLTPHTLRRTFASLLAEVGVSPRRAMYLIGHADPTLTMRVYQQVLDLGSGGLEALERVLGCGPDEACATWSERADWGLKADPRPISPQGRTAARNLP
jgi:integrase